MSKIFNKYSLKMLGYRPILDAMKSFAIDEKPIEIEELYKLKCLNNKQISSSSKKSIHIINDTLEWYSPLSLEDLLQLLNEYQSSEYRLIGGNTG